MPILLTQTIEELNNGKKLKISKRFFFRVLLSKKEKKCRKLSLNSKLFRTD